MKGVPLRVNIGIRDIREEQVELIRRDTRERFYVKEKDLVNETLSILENIQSNMYHLAKNYLVTNKTTADIRIIPFNTKKNISSCIACRKEGTTEVYFGRAY